MQVREVFSALCEVYLQPVLCAVSRGTEGAGSSKQGPFVPRPPLVGLWLCPKCVDGWEDAPAAGLRQAVGVPLLCTSRLLSTAGRAAPPVFASARR